MNFSTCSHAKMEGERFLTRASSVLEVGGRQKPSEHSYCSETVF